MSQHCSRHPGESAAYVCDGCGEFLCIDCTREGKALTFCGLCGEMALPVDEMGRVVEFRAPVAPPRSAAAAYSLTDALLFPLRRIQAVILGLFALLFTFVETLGFLYPEASGLMDPARMGLALTLANVLADAVRSTALGDNDLEGIPDYREPGKRFAEVVSFVILGALTIATAAFFLSIVGCFNSLLAGEGVGFRCILGLMLGAGVSGYWWLFGFGAGTLMDSVLTTIRLDQHWLALNRHPADAARLIALPAAFLVIAVAIPWFAPGFLAASLIRAYLTLYTVFLGAHLTGLFFRWHLEEMRELYR